MLKQMCGDSLCGRCITQTSSTLRLLTDVVLSGAETKPVRVLDFLHLFGCSVLSLLYFRYSVVTRLGFSPRVKYSDITPGYTTSTHTRRTHFGWRMSGRERLSEIRSLTKMLKPFSL